MSPDLQRLQDLVRYARGLLHDDGLISDEEYAALVADSENGSRVARLESYDTLQADLSAARANEKTCAGDLSEAWELIRKQKAELDALRDQVAVLRSQLDCPNCDWDQHEIAEVTDQTCGCPCRRPVTPVKE
jgi:hypothetical protein